MGERSKANKKMISPTVEWYRNSKKQNKTKKTSSDSMGEMNGIVAEMPYWKLGKIFLK